MKDKIFGVLQRVGRSFMLPIAILPVAGLLLGIGSSFTNAVTLQTYGLTRFLGEGTALHALLVIMNKVGSVIFDNLPLLFAVGVAIGMAKKEKEVAALSAVIAYFVMHTAVNAMLTINGQLSESGELADTVLEGTVASACGILTLQMGVFGGVIVGLGVAGLHNRFYRLRLPNALSFFGGTRFVPIISTLVYMLVGIVMYFVWPIVQNGIFALGGLVSGSGYLGTLIFGLIKRALIPFGLHHVFYMPFWHTAVGGTMEIAGQTVQGGQNIFFAQLANSSEVAHFSSEATRFFSGEFIFMIFGLPGAALAMYHCARPERKKSAGGLLLSAALTCMATGITEPLEFSFLFVAPMLFAVQVLLAGSAYMVAHMLDISIGLTFSGGLLDFFLFGILQGNEKTGWLKVLPVGVVYFFLYYFIFKFLIKRFHLKTPGREEGEEETRLYSKADSKNREREEAKEKTDALEKTGSHNLSEQITRGLGGRENISDVDCCATRLRCTVKEPSLVEDAVLKATGASGVIHRGQGVQIIYGPHVTGIKSDLEEYLLSEPKHEKTHEKTGKTMVEEEKKRKYDKEERKLVHSLILSSPIAGLAAPLDTAPDEGFAEGMMGQGAVVIPLASTVVAPEDGEVTFVFDTGHALGFLTDTGISLLIHIGMDTVSLEGRGFQPLAEEGQRVKKGTPLLKLDLEYLSSHAPSMVSPIVCTELSGNQKVRLLKQGEIGALEAFLAVDSYE